MRPAALSPDYCRLTELGKTPRRTAVRRGIESSLAAAATRVTTYSLRQHSVATATTTTRRRTVRGKVRRGKFGGCGGTPAAGHISSRRRARRGLVQTKKKTGCTCGTTPKGPQHDNGATYNQRPGTKKERLHSIHSRSST